MTAPTPLSEWLAAHGLEQYGPVLAQNAVGLDVLPYLSDADLKDLGIPLGDRRRMLLASRSLQQAAHEVSRAASDPPMPAQAITRDHPDKYMPGGRLFGVGLP